MLRTLFLTATLTTLSCSVWAANTRVEMQTSLGNVEIELFNDKAPITVKNFENYVNSNFYNGTVFHRVIPGFMIQGGGMAEDLKEKPTKAPIVNESYNGLLNNRGSIAMARTNDPNSASSQFFINVKDNNFLDKSNRNAGYAVFGRVVKGMDVVDQISNVKTKSVGFAQDVPQTPIKITSIKIKSEKQ